MKRLLLASTILAAVGTSPVVAADTAVILWNAANPGGAVVESGTGSADLGPQDLGGITVTLTTANRFTGPNALNAANIQIVNTDTTAQTFDMIVGANNYPGPSSLFSLSGTIIVNAIMGGTSVADLMGSYFVDSGDTLNGLSTSVVGTDIQNFDSATLTGPNSFSFNGFGTDGVTGPYGMAERLQLTLQPGASVGVQGVSMEAVIPEPRTWAMMLIGFALMGLVGYKRSRSARFAV